MKATKPRLNREVVLFCLGACTKPARLFWAAIILSPVGYILGAVIATSAPATTINWLISKSQHDLLGFVGYVCLYALPLVVSVFCLRCSEVLLAHIKTHVRRTIEQQMLQALLGHTLTVSQRLGSPLNAQKMIASLNGICELLILTCPSLLVQTVIVVAVLEFFSVAPIAINALMLLLAIVAVGISCFGAARQFPLLRQVNDQESAISEHYAATYDNEVARTNPAFEHTRHDSLINAWQSARNRSLQWAITNTCIIQAWANFMLIVLFILVTVNVFEGNLNAPIGLLVFAYILQLRSSVDAIGGVLYGLQENLAAASAMYEFLKEPQLVDGEVGETISSSSLEVEGLTVGYCDQKTGQETFALDRLTQQFGPHQTVALIGPIGAGKSSFFRAITRADECLGVVRLGGYDIQKLSRHRIAVTCAYVPQHSAISSSLTIGEYIRYGLPISQETVELAAKLAGIADLIQTKGGYDVKGIRSWSVGQQQLLSITRAFAWLMYNQSPFLFMDEPTSALDPLQEAQLQQGIAELLKLRQVTLVIVAHRLSTVQNADLVMVLERGKLVESGSHAALLNQKSRYAAMREAQMLV